MIPITASAARHDTSTIAAVRQAMPAIAEAATILAERLAAGGRLAYAGAGTSIRVAVQVSAVVP